VSSIGYHYATRYQRSLHDHCAKLGKPNYSRHWGLSTWLHPSLICRLRHSTNCPPSALLWSHRGSRRYHWLADTTLDSVFSDTSEQLLERYARHARLTAARLTDVRCLMKNYFQPVFLRQDIFNCRFRTFPSFTLHCFHCDSLQEKIKKFSGPATRYQCAVCVADPW